jgi:hypothetical protein
VALNWVKSEDGSMVPVTLGEGGSRISSQSLFPSEILTSKMKDTLKKKF